MNPIFFIILFAFFLWIFRNTLFWVGLWQDKEYRLDRLFVHFRETKQGKKIFSSVGNIAKWILLASFPLIFTLRGYFYIFSIIIEIFFLSQAIFVLKDAFFHKIKRPVFTIKASALIFVTLIVVIFILPAPVFSFFFILLTLDRLLPFFIALLVGFFAIPTWIHKKYIAYKAKKRMQNFPKIKIIAVSGSYGKTSTKEYIAQVLSGKFKVVKTPGSNNTPIGIAKIILSDIKKDTDFFVVEMGAYKSGEIKELCQIVRPAISVTTAISDQHLSLYGSIENVIASEFELISAMDSDGISLFNADSMYMDKLFEKTQHKKIYFKTIEKKSTSEAVSGIVAYDVQADLGGVSLTIALGKEQFSVKAPVLGTQAAQNILPAVYIARLCGLKTEEIKREISHLISPPKTMQKILLKNNALGIDDTFNASPESVSAALEYLKLGKKKKYLVFSPLTELGGNAPLRHKEIGKLLGSVCDKVFILNKNFSTEIIQGINDANNECDVVFVRTQEIIKSLSTLISQDDIVIFEGKESGMILKKLL